MHNYQFNIPNPKAKTYAIITFIMVSINLFGFGLVFFKVYGIAQYITILGIFTSAVPWLYYLLNKKNLPLAMLAISLIVSSIMWFYFNNVGVGVLVLVFATLGYFTTKKSIIFINNEAITYPAITNKKYSWAQVSNVLYKDDILTIDLKNNTLYQIKLEQPLANQQAIDTFNTFCKNCIQAITLQ